MLSLKRVQDPQLGRGLGLRMEQGGYEHQQLGIRLEEIVFEVSVYPERIALHSFSAKTPGTGILEAEGELKINEFSTSEGSFQLSFDQARLLHLDPVRASVSGNVTIEKKSGEDFFLSGNLVSEEIQIFMDRLPGPPPKVLAHTILGQTTAAEEPTSKRAIPETPGLKLSGKVTLEIPGGFRVQGQNMMSTWEGNLEISQRPKGIFLSGKLNPQRGTVTFFGKAFRLEGGSVYFNNLLQASPLLDLEASFSRADVDAQLRISGRANDPTFDLSSTPPMPEDEVVSYILFGKDLAAISGLQALQVGLALKSMMDRNEASSWDLVGNAREFLGVDELALRESRDAKGGTELIAGRQLNDVFYIEVSRNLQEPDSSIILEYDLRKNISITTETGTHILPGIGLNWKYDY
jgi:translocation and assembly module TamB